MTVSTCVGTHSPAPLPPLPASNTPPRTAIRYGLGRHSSTLSYSDLIIYNKVLDPYLPLCSSSSEPNNSSNFNSSNSSLKVPGASPSSPSNSPSYSSTTASFPSALTTLVPGFSASTPAPCPSPLSVPLCSNACPYCIPGTRRLLWTEEKRRNASMGRRAILRRRC